METKTMRKAITDFEINEELERRRRELAAADMLLKVLFYGCIIGALVWGFAIWLVRDAAAAEPPATINYHALATIESSNNPHADSFLGAKYGRGLYQVSEIALKDYNALNHTAVTVEELYNPDTNRLIATWLIERRIPQLLTHYGQAVTVESVLQAYNLGAKAYAGGKRNNRYITKYKRAVKNDNNS